MQALHSHFKARWKPGRVPLLALRENRAGNGNHLCNAAQKGLIRVNI